MDGTPGRRPTLQDVAARAGVSRALVSIVMRGVPGASAETRQRVLAAADAMGYRPDTRARLLASDHSRQLGVVFGLAGRFHAELLDGLYVAAGAAGYELVLSALTPNRTERSAVEALLDLRCEAVILLEPGVDAVPVVTGKLPVTVVGWPVDDPAVDVVRASDDDGMHAAVDHLVDLGHRAIAHVDGGDGPAAAARRRAYRAAMRRHGLDGQVLVIRGGDSLEHGLRAARELLSVLRDEPASDGVAADSRASDGGAADSTAADGRASDSRASDSRAADSRASDSRASDSRASDSRASDGVASDGRASDGGARPTAVVGYNDDVAAGLAESLAFAGVRVPADVSVVGWDDNALARLPHLDLTTVRQDPVALARLAVERCVARLRGEPVPGREVVLPAELVVRGSTATARPGPREPSHPDAPNR